MSFERDPRTGPPVRLLRRFRPFPGPRSSGKVRPNSRKPTPAGCGMFKFPRPGRSKRATMRRVLLLVILTTFIGDGPALASSLLEFPNLPGREPVQLIGYLARPDTGLSALIRTTSRDVAPYPGVIVLHGCGGISSHSVAIADRLGAWGYVALTIDTLGPRGIVGLCYANTYIDQAFDAYAALRYLSRLEF